MVDPSSSGGEPSGSKGPTSTIPTVSSSGTSGSSAGKYKNPTTLISNPKSVRTHKTELERAQGANRKFSTLQEKGKKVLKAGRSANTIESRFPSKKELTRVYRATGNILSYDSKLPTQSAQSSKVSSKAVSPKSTSNSSVSYHSSLSSGPAFALPKHYTSLNDVCELLNHNQPSRSPSPKSGANRAVQHDSQRGQASLQQKPSVSTPQRSNTSTIRTEPAAPSTNPHPDKCSGGGPASTSKQICGVQARGACGAAPVKQQPRETNNWGNLRRSPHSTVPQSDQALLKSLKTVQDVRKNKIFPSVLSYNMQTKLCTLLDSLNVEASDFAKQFVLSRVKTDQIKNLHYCFLISNFGKIHFFNSEGFYVGAVPVNEPTWFYGRIAGCNRNMYLSLGNGKTSKCFLKTRFPTLKEFVSSDWAKGKSSLKYVTVFDPVKNRNWRGDRGFCWLPLYLDSNIPLSEYPTSGLVRLFTLYDKFGLVPIIRSGKYYHYDVNGKTHIKFPNVWVGAASEDASNEITTWEDCNSDPMLKQAVESVLKRTVLKETSNFQTNIDNLFDKALSFSLHSTKSEKISISQHLNADEFDLLKTYFGLPYLGNGTQPRNPHSLLNAMRECYNKIYQKAFRGVTVSDIGGNLASAIQSDCNNYHICMPLLDAKDAARQTKSVISIFNSLDRKYDDTSAIGKRLQSLKTITFCSKPVPQCPHKSTVIVMVDVYDVHLRALLKSMEKKGALLARCCFMYPPELISADGTVVHPEVGVVVTRDGNVIKYHIADTSDCYMHDVSNIMSYIKTSSIVSNSGLLYSVELLNQNGPYLDFQISLSSNSSNAKTTRSYRTWLRGKSEVTVRRLHNDGSVRISRIILDRDFVRRVLSYSANVCNTIDDRTFEYVLSNIRSQTTMMIVGSKIVHNKVDLSNDIVIELPGTFLKEAVRRRRRTVEQAKQSRGGFLNLLLNTLLGAPWKILNWLLNQLRKLLPHGLKTAFDSLLAEEDLISDCPDVLSTEVSNDVSACPLKNDILADVLEVVKELTLLSAPEAEITEESDDGNVGKPTATSTSENQRKIPTNNASHQGAGLRGGGDNWYDFLLPKEANKKTGSSLMSDLWRIVRKIDKACRSSSVFSLASRLLKFILRVLQRLFAPILHSISCALPKKENVIEVPKQDVCLVGKIFGTFVGGLLRFLNLPFFRDVFDVLRQTGFCVADNVSSKVGQLKSSTINCLKTKIACGLKAMNMKPPSGWLDERTVVRIFFDNIISKYSHIALPGIACASLLLLLSSKTVREGLMGFSHKAVCLIERVRIKRPVVLISILLGTVFNGLSSVGLALTPFEDCREICVGLMFSNILSSVGHCWESPSFANKAKLLLNFIFLQKNFSLLTSLLTLTNSGDSAERIRDVTDVTPVLSDLTLNADVQDTIKNFRGNISDLKLAVMEKKAGKAVKEDETSDVRTFQRKSPQSNTHTEARNVGTKNDCKSSIGRETNVARRSSFEVGSTSNTKDDLSKKSEEVQTTSEKNIEPESRVPDVEPIVLKETKQDIFESDVADDFTGFGTPIEEKSPKLSESTTDATVNDLDKDVDTILAFDSAMADYFVEEHSEGDDNVLEKGSEGDDTNSKIRTGFTFESLPDLNCECGANISVNHFVAPGPLPLVAGDRLNGREAWFYSRGGEGYSYTGYTHKSRGWLRILDDFVSATGLQASMFDHCLVQKYQPGSGIPFHKDNEPVYPKTNPILTIHVDGEGIFFIKCANGGGKIAMRNPCWFLMPNGFQISHQHSVHCATVRVSMTFRSTVPISDAAVRKSLANVSPVNEQQVDVSREVKRSVCPTPKSNTVVLRPQYSRSTEVQAGKQKGSLLDVCCNIMNVQIREAEDLLDLSKYNGMRHYVNVSGNLGCVVEAFLYNLHELHREVSVLTKAVNQPDVLVGKKREVFCSSTPDLDMIKVCKSPDLLLTSTINTFYASVNRRTLMFSNDKDLQSEDSVLYLAPSNISFPLRRCFGILTMLKSLNLADIERALVGCKFINAVPGAGKTYEIKQLMRAHSQSKSNKALMLVLTSSRNAAETLSEFWESEIGDRSIKVMTVDSFIFSGGHFTSEGIDTVLLDECYMSHAGLCILISALTNPSNLSFYGDRRQVPFTNRNPLFRDSMSMLNVSKGEYTERLLTYRCPADICYWMSRIDFIKPGDRFYSGDVKTVKDGRPLKSVRMATFSPNQLDFMKRVDRVMTFTQMEKADLISKFLNSGFGSKEHAEKLIGTVAESQGETYAKVALVRTKAADDPVFTSFPHRLVALTRHTQSLEFICLPNKISKGIGKDVQMIEKLEESVAKTFVVQQHV